MCALSGNATVCETLKNLILPSIGSFTIVDDAVVTEADCGSNFFVELSHLGARRAEVVRTLLSELNPDVHGHAVVENPSSLVRDNADFFAAFNVILVSEMPRAELALLAGIAHKAGAALVVVRSYGFFGYCRLMPAGGIHLVTDAHPDFPKPDLRLLSPFAELVQLACLESYADVPDSETGDVPAPLLVLQALDQYRALHDGALPRTAKEKNEVKNLLGLMRRNLMDENIQQAIDKIGMWLAPSAVPSGTQAVLDHPLCTANGTPAPHAWVVMRAVRAFLRRPDAPAGEANQLPHAGAIPDLTASSRRYIALQQAFKAKSKRDLDAVYGLVQRELSAMQLPDDAISRETSDRLAKAAADVAVVEYADLARELSEGPSRATVETWRTVLSVREYPAPDKNLIIYFLLLAADLFFEQMRRWPGAVDDWEGDVPLLKDALREVLVKFDLTPDLVPADYLHEMCRYAAGELHSTAAFMGGVASQEILKLRTSQFVPFKNTFIFNGITSSGSVYDL